MIMVPMAIRHPGPKSAGNENMNTAITILFTSEIHQMQNARM